MNKKAINRAIILFDEQGTPTFSDKRESDYFLGVSVTYVADYENELFNNCSDLFGFSKSMPLKNDKIAISRVYSIADMLSHLDLQINIHYIVLSNQDLQSTVRLYEDFSNTFREKFRNVRSRPIPQILYTEMLEHALFISISDYMKYNKITTKFSLYIDNWCFPSCDVDIAINCNSLERKNNDINQKFFPGAFTICDDLVLLDEDSNRKRFIDIVASVISRNFLDRSNPKYCNDILTRVIGDNNHNFSQLDITETTVKMLKYVMEDVSRNG